MLTNVHCRVPITPSSKGGPPREGSADTMQQLAAIFARVVFFHHEPYADFARLAPQARRAQKALCHKALADQAWRALGYSSGFQTYRSQRQRGAVDTFDASWSEDLNTVASDDEFWAAQVRYPA